MGKLLENIEETRKTICESISSIDELIDKLDRFRDARNGSDWYVSGGCYVFAVALNKILNGSKIIAIGDDLSDLAHVCVFWKGFYIDYNSVSRNIKDIVSNFTISGQPVVKEIKANILKGQHNYSDQEAEKIIAELS